MNDICPLCNQCTVFTLDHYLPQSAHAALPITPPNLVPSCSECNTTKNALMPQGPDDLTLHPYFDQCDDARWLVATVQQTLPVSVKFSAVPPVQWSAIKRARVVHHFTEFKLGALYASRAGEEMTSLGFMLRDLQGAGKSPGEIQQFLQVHAAGISANHPNSWQAPGPLVMFDSNGIGESEETTAH